MSREPESGAASGGGGKPKPRVGIGLGGIAWQLHKVKQATKHMRPTKSWKEVPRGHLEGVLGVDAVVFLHAFVPTKIPAVPRAVTQEIKPGKRMKDEAWAREHGHSDRLAKLADHKDILKHPRYVIDFSCTTKIFDVAEVVKAALWDLATVHSRITVVGFSMGGLVLGLALLDDYLLDFRIRERMRAVLIDTPWLGMNPEVVKWMGNHGYDKVLSFIEHEGPCVSGTPFTAFQHMESTTIISQAMKCFDHEDSHVVSECVGLFSFPAFPDGYEEAFTKTPVPSPYVVLRPTEVRSLALRGMRRLVPEHVCLVSILNIPSISSHPHLFIDDGDPEDLLDGVEKMKVVYKSDHKSPWHYVLDTASAHVEALRNAEVIAAVASFIARDPIATVDEIRDSDLDRMTFSPEASRASTEDE